MDQFITKPLKRFLGISKGNSKKNKASRNFNSIQHLAQADKVEIDMSGPKSLLYQNLDNPTNLQNNNGQFSKHNSAPQSKTQTLNAVNSTNFTQNTDDENLDGDKNMYVETNKLNHPETKDSNKTDPEFSSQSDNSEKINESQRPQLVKIKITLNKDENIDPNSPSIISSSINSPSINSTSANSPSVSSNTSPNFPSKVESWTKAGEEPRTHESTGVDEHRTAKFCMFDETKSYPLSPISLMSLSPTSVIDNLIEFHERQMKHLGGRSMPGRLPRMGTNSLHSRSGSQSPATDSEIINALVREKFIANLYQNRSYRRKKPSNYGRIYRSLERSLGVTSEGGGDFSLPHFNTIGVNQENQSHSNTIGVNQDNQFRLNEQYLSLGPKFTSVNNWVLQEKNLPPPETEEMFSLPYDINLCVDRHLEDPTRGNLFEKDAEGTRDQQLTGRQLNTNLQGGNTSQETTGGIMTQETTRTQEATERHMAEEATRLKISQQMTAANMEERTLEKYTNQKAPTEFLVHGATKPKMLEESLQKCEDQKSPGGFMSEESTRRSTNLEATAANISQETTNETATSKIIGRHIIQEKTPKTNTAPKHAGEKLTLRTTAQNPPEDLKARKSEARNLKEEISQEIKKAGEEPQETFGKSPERLQEISYTERNSSTPNNLELDYEERLEQVFEKGLETTITTEPSSYDMEDFLKTALGDELNSSRAFDSATDNSIGYKEEKRIHIPNKKPPMNEESICTSDASELISKINTAQSSFYKSLAKKLQHMTDTIKLASPQKLQIDPHLDFEAIYTSNEKVTALIREAAVQYEAMKQLTKALALCRSTKEFCSSEEQVEGERLLLVATYKRQALLKEVQRLQIDSEESSPSIETGTLMISEMSLPLKKEVNEQQQQQRRDHNRWYVCIFSYGSRIVSTQPTLARSDGNVCFAEEVIFTDLPSDFSVNLEVYCLMQKRNVRNFSHESKFHINKDVKKSHCPSPKKLLHRDKTSQKIPEKHETSIRVSSFKLHGCLNIQVADLSKSGPWYLRKVPLCSSFSGSVTLHLQSFVQIPVKHTGFLTIGTEIGEFVAWNRRWCVLEGHIFRYWNYPYEEDSSIALREIDLKQCVNARITTVDRSLCARARTLLMETARIFSFSNSDDQNETIIPPALKVDDETYSVEKYFLSADNVSDLKTWDSKLNSVVGALHTWNVNVLS